MASFEPIREAAAALHRSVVNASVDALDPWALVTAAVERLGLELFELPASDPALKGARAVFDEQSGAILFEADLGGGERALLVAHEIGHSQVHTGSLACSQEDIDPSQSLEAAPVGLQRVEDYGARERRELEANVFAREFLLPRMLAERLHMEDGLGAVRIHQRTGLPLPVVRQQLFDALLLPSRPRESSALAAAPALRPDPSQERAVEHRGAPFQLQAGPGTGKTRTLVERVCSLVADGVEPTAILVLTFSNRAAGELSQRLLTAVPDAAPGIWVGTFHAFGLDLVRRHHERFGLPVNPRLFDRSDAIEVLEEILPTLPLVHYRNLWDPTLVLRDILAAISRAKDELTDAAKYRTLGESMLESAVDPDERVVAEKCLEVARVFEIYQRALAERGAVDFGDLIMRPAVLLESDPVLAQVTRLRHRHLLVDEYQDVNRASARLLKAVAGDGKRLWVVGDARQSIYRFRGASALNMEKFDTDYDGAVRARLETNYRSTEEIVSSLVAIAPRMGSSRGTLPLDLVASRGRGPARPQVRRYETLEEEAAGVASSVRELESAGVALRDQAVLCRSNARLSDMATALEAHGVPVLHLGSLFEREEVRDLLAIMSLAVDRFGDSLLRVAAIPRYNASLQDVYAAVRHLRETDQRAFGSLKSLADVDGLSEAGVSAFGRLAEDLDGLDPRASAWDFLSAYLLDRTDLAREMARGATVRHRMRAVAVWQFLNLVRKQSVKSSGLRIRRTLDRVRQLVLLAEERDLRQVPAAAIHLDAVSLMTVHGSKGLEFEAVHVPGLTKVSFPTNNRGQRCPPPAGMIEVSAGRSVKDELKRSHEHEEQCLFFVALSRARSHLRLYLARRQPNGRKRAPSPFLDWIAPSPLENVDYPSTLSLAASVRDAAEFEVEYGEGWRITDSSLRSYESCPRRFFYTHVVGLRGARKPTAFTKTHDCLYEVIRWLVDARREADPTLAEAHAELRRIWVARGPVDHAFAEDYWELAARLVTRLVEAGGGRRFRDARPLTLDLPQGRVVVEPSEIADLPNGRVSVRRVRTGRRRVDEYDRLQYALYKLATDLEFGVAGAVEALHLTDGVAENVTITPRKLSTRRIRADDLLRGIAESRFPAIPDSVRCPRCPHFFICPSKPRGRLSLC